MLVQLSWLVKVVTCTIDLLLNVFHALCQTKPGWSLTKILKLIVWLKAVNKVRSLWSVVPLAMFFYHFWVPKSLIDQK